MRVLGTFAVLAGVVALGHPASAAPAAESPEALIDRGLNLRRQGKPTEALFERANAEAHSARAIAQVGLAEMSLHRWIDADTHIAAALSRHDSDWIENPKTRETLQKALADVGRHLGRVRIEGTSGAEITIDGRAVGRLPLPGSVAVNPSAIRIRATAPGHQPFDLDVVATAGEEIVARTDFVPVPIAVPSLGAQPLLPPAAPLSPPDDHRWRQWTGTALVGGGVAAVAIGVVWLAINGKGTCEPAPGGTCQQNYDTSLQGWLALGAGAALVGAGVGLILWHGHDDQLSLSLGPSFFAAMAKF
jgi:hypothetical protein